MNVSNLSMAFMVDYFKPLIENAFIDKIQLIEKDVYRIRLNNKSDLKDLIINQDLFYFSRYKINAVQKQGFHSLLQKFLHNKKINSFNQINFDRLIELNFNEFNLIIEFFPVLNLVLTDSNHKIIASLKSGKFKERTIKKGQQYFFPKAKLNPRQIPLKELISLLKKSNDTLIRFLIFKINLVPFVLEQVCFNAGIEKQVISNNLSENEVNKIFNELKKITEINLEKFKPVVADNNLLPFPFTVLKTKQEINNFTDFLDDFYSQKLLKPSEEKKEKLESKVSFSLKELEKKKIEFEKEISLNTKKANFIYVNYTKLKELINLIQSFRKSGFSDIEILDRLKLKTGFKVIGIKRNKIELEVVL